MRFSSLESSSINYRVSGDERDVDHLSEKIEELIMSTKQWFSFLGNGYIGLIIITLVITFIAFISTISLFGFNEPTLNWLLPIGMFDALASIKIRAYLFPIYSFELGDGIERIKKMHTIRSFIFGTVFTSLIVGIIVNYLTSKL